MRITHNSEMRRRLPNTPTLVAFEAAARLESFSKAAESLNLTQGAISRQLQTLEGFLATKLFHRANGRIYLNKAGRQLLLELSPLLDGLETAISAVQDINPDDATLAIATYPTLAARWLVSRRLAYESITGNPSIKIAVILANAAFDVDRFDVGVLQGIPPWKGCRHSFLMYEDLVVAGAPNLVGHKELAIGDLLNSPYLRHLTRPISFRIWSESAGDPHADPLGGSLFEQYDMMIEAAVAGHGIGVFPKLLVDRELIDGRLILAHPHVARPEAAYYIVTPETAYSKANSADFSEWLSSTV